MLSLFAFALTAPLTTASRRKFVFRSVYAIYCIRGHGTRGGPVTLTPSWLSRILVTNSRNTPFADHLLIACLRNVAVFIALYYPSLHWSSRAVTYAAFVLSYPDHSWDHFVAHAYVHPSQRTKIYRHKLSYILLLYILPQSAFATVSGLLAEPTRVYAP